MWKYTDKRVGIDENDKWSLKNLVNEEFKKIDKYWYRDDQEIRNAWRNVCNKLIQEIKNDKTKVYGRWALEPLTKLIADLKKEHENMKWMSLFTNNKDKINQVANRIDNAEKEVLKRLSKNRTTQDSRNIVNKWNETNKDKPMFVMEWWNDYRKQTWNIIFTKESNPVKIHEALKWLFTNPNIVYEIDYSWCKNQAIKEKMSWLIWAQTCYLRYDKEQKTYTIRDKNWSWISDRAYIWEWVKLIPAWVRARQTYTEQKSQNENLWKLNNNQIGFLTKAMLKDIPSAKDLTAEEQKDLVTKTENRITELLKRAKKLWYDLESECISKKHFWYWHMELHLNSGSSEVDWTVWGNDGSHNKILWKNLDNFIDSNEWEYKTYLTNRVKAKWQELDALTKTETVNVWKKLQREQTKEEKEKSETDKQQMLYWIWLLEKMVDNYKESEWDSRLDSDDKDLITIKKLINNAKVSIENSNNIEKDAIIKNFLNPIRERWASIKNIAKTYKPQYNELKTVFFWSKNEQISAIRNLWWRNRIFDKTETSFLAEEIEWNDDLWVKDQEVQKCIDNIKNRTTMSIYNKDWSINQKVKWRYDNTYASAKRWTDSLITLFVGRNWLPKNWKKEEKEVRKCMDNLKDKLNSIDSQVNNLNLSVNSMIKEQHQKRLKLEQKQNKTEDEIKTLQSLVYLDENQEKAKEIYKDTIEKTNIELKYWNLWQVVKWWLMSALWELWWWITWSNADIYNDIKWYWRFNLSDENAKLAWEIITEIAITVAVAVVTWWVWWVAMATALRWAAFAARWAKWVSLANKIYKVLNISQKWYKWLSIWAKAVKLWYRWTSLLLEGTAFNAASNMIHSAMNGTSLDNLNLNPIAKENVQTAAFLWALSVGNQLAWTLMKAWWRTKVWINLAKWLEKAHLKAPAIRTTWVVTELGTMLWAEQVINVTFGHDVIDPETWEIHTERTLVAPTQEELCQTVWMILAFKMVKPWLWHKYEQKLNNWTMEICRSVKKNEVLIRNIKTWKVEKIQDIIDGKNNNYKPTPEQYRLRNHNRWREKQSKYELEILQAQEKIWELPESSRSEATKKLLEAWDIVNLSPNDIKRIQREIWLKWKEVDWVLWPKSLKELNEYFDNKNDKKIENEPKKRIQNTNELEQYYNKLKNILESRNTGSIKEYIERKNVFLERNRTLSDKEFNELFWKSWKFWKVEISQRDLWMCYAYTWFELLKKCNCFDVIIKTSVKESTQWREVKIPLWEKNWKWIKVNREEIDKNFTISKDWKSEIFNINSKSEYNWFKVLEIAYIKSRIIEKLWKNSKIWEEFNKTWDITLTWDLIKLVEWWNTQSFFKTMLWDKVVAEYMNVREQADQIFDNFTKWELLVNVGIHRFWKNYPKWIEKFNLNNNECLIVENVNAIEENWNKIIKDWYTKNSEWVRKRTNELNDLLTINWKQYVAIFKTHQYSIEKCFIDKKTWEKKVRIVNPRYSSIKYEMSFEKCKKIFDNRGVACLKTDEMFKIQPERKPNNNTNKWENTKKEQTEQQERKQKEKQRKQKEEQKMRQREEEQQQQKRQGTNSAELYQRRFGEFNQEFANIVKNNQDRIINLEKIENIDSFMTESFEFLKKEMWIDDPNLKIKILEWNEWVDNHYDRSTNTVYFSRNFWWERQIYLKWWDKAEIFWWIWHELNHYLQETEIIKHYLKDNETINKIVEWFNKNADREWINRYINQININEPISERAITYAKGYMEALEWKKDWTIFDKDDNIVDYNKYRNLSYEKESFDRWDILADEYRKATKSYKQVQQRKKKEDAERKAKEEQERKDQERKQQEKEREQRRKQREEQENNRYTEKIKLTENINVDYKSWNMSYEVKEYLDNPNTCKPFFETNIDWQQIFLTAPQKLFNSGFSGYNGYVWFIRVNWQYEIRYFIKSWSEGLWRCCPWYCWKNVSKLDEFNNASPETKKQLIENWFNYTWNFSYERSTMVDFRLWQTLESLYFEIRGEWWELSNKRSNYYPNDYDYVNISANSKDINKRKRFIDMSKEIDVTDDFSKKFWKKMGECTWDEVKNIYKNETLWIDLNSFTREKGKTYRYYHEQFESMINVEVYTAKMWWKDVEIFFSHTENEPDLVWIDNIQYKNQRINSYWVASNQINAWWLTKKPMDYREQCPKWYDWKIYWYDKYMDIRALYQENPLIKKYKELSQQSRVAA